MRLTIKKVIVDSMFFNRYNILSLPHLGLLLAGLLLRVARSILYPPIRFYKRAQSSDTVRFKEFEALASRKHF